MGRIAVTRAERMIPQHSNSANNDDRHDTTISIRSFSQSSSWSFADETTALRLVMPPRLPLRAQRGLLSTNYPQCRIVIQWRCYTSPTATATPEIYDVVCVGGGPAGLSLLTGLRASPVTSGLRVALIEGQDLAKNQLQQDASLDSFSNRCSSLTPASVKNLQGNNCPVPL